jgi:hypothetical protein
MADKKGTVPTHTVGTGRKIQAFRTFTRNANWSCRVVPSPTVRLTGLVSRPNVPAAAFVSGWVRDLVDRAEVEVVAHVEVVASEVVLEARLTDAVGVDTDSARNTRGE